ncbi:hypothetical protein MSAN_00586100 [Mycena sanguinolenta]|uniref:Uncharacterized protein n=1 Tax=Mycena sanguinolenta TaxID=230812 RepID=A0A8H6ZCF9_9AGAR|nr:hypothetical protein MSAN_00586100 [Mycena sanguinolenta]
MSDDNRCRGTTADGQRCICLRAENTYIDDDQRTKCRDCDHIASAHPQAKPSISSFVRSFQDAAQVHNSSSGSQSVKASREEAAAETSAGLRNVKKRKPDSSSDTAPKKVKKVKAGKQKATETRAKNLTRYGTAILLPWGLTDDGQLRQTTTPSQHEFDRLRQAKLVVFDTPDQPLVINSTWSNAEANEAVTGLFPDAFRFLFRKHSGEAQLWLGATVYKKTLTVASDSRPTALQSLWSLFCLDATFGNRAVARKSKLAKTKSRRKCVTAVTAGNILQSQKKSESFFLFSWSFALCEQLKSAAQILATPSRRFCGGPAINAPLVALPTTATA